MRSSIIYSLWSLLKSNNDLFVSNQNCEIQQMRILNQRKLCYIFMHPKLLKMVNLHLIQLLFLNNILLLPFVLDVFVILHYELWNVGRWWYFNHWKIHSFWCWSYAVRNGFAGFRYQFHVIFRRIKISRAEKTQTRRKFIIWFYF